MKLPEWTDFLLIGLLAFAEGVLLGMAIMLEVTGR